MEFEISLEQLARETIALSYCLQDQDRVGLFTSNGLPNSSGVVYYLERGISSFCIRGEAFENLQMASLEDQCLFFETPSVEIANVLADSIFNRRFPYSADVMSHISDAGPSWWLDYQKGLLTVHFKNHAVYRTEKFIPLGPIGDSQLAVQRFARLGEFFKELFPVHSFEVTDRHVAILSDGMKNPNFRALVKMFVEGEIPNFSHLMPLKAQYFLEEIAIIRKFWITIENLLEEEAQKRRMLM